MRQKWNNWRIDERIVIHPKNIPVRLGLQDFIIIGLLLDKFNTPIWLWMEVFGVLILYKGWCLYMISKEKFREIFDEKGNLKV